MITIRRLALCSLLAVLVACGADRPLVERRDAQGWQPSAFQLASMGGQRAGATVSFILRLEEPSGRRLVVEGRVEIDPQARLVEGHWVERGAASERVGLVSSSTIDFFGGQGDRPSLGGQLTLSSDGAEFYRINLPPTQLGQGR